MKTSLRFSAVALALAACGGAPGNPYGTPVATLQGTITAAAVSTPSELHVALVWDHITEHDGELRSAQEVNVRAEFPVRFKIDILDPPPLEAMNALSPEDAQQAGVDPSTFRFALGSVLVYEDGNGNGKLDLLTLNATTSIDRPLGAAKPWIIYVEGAPPADGLFGVSLVPGFNLIAESTASCNTDNGVDEFCRPRLESLPLTTELDIALSNDPRLAALLCQNGGGAVSGGGGGAGSDPSAGGDGAGEPAGPGFVPPDPGATVDCAEDNRSFVADKCEQPTLCSDTTCVRQTGQLQPGEPVPAGWPCPGA
jgi:hypothetical protein